MNSIPPFLNGPDFHFHLKSVHSQLKIENIIVNKCTNWLKLQVISDYFMLILARRSCAA